MAELLPNFDNQPQSSARQANPRKPVEAEVTTLHIPAEAPCDHPQAKPGSNFNHTLNDPLSPKKLETIGEAEENDSDR